MALEAAGIGECRLKDLMRIIAATLLLGNVSRQDGERVRGCPLAAAAGLLRIDATCVSPAKSLKVLNSPFHIDILLTTFPAPAPASACSSLTLNVTRPSNDRIMCASC